MGHLLFHRDFQWLFWQGFVPITGAVFTFWFVGKLHGITASKNNRMPWPSTSEVLDPVGWLAVCVVACGSTAFSALQVVIGRPNSREIGLLQLVSAGFFLFGSWGLQVLAIHAKVSAEQQNQKYEPTPVLLGISFALACAAVAIGCWSNATLNPAVPAPLPTTP